MSREYEISSEELTVKTAVPFQTLSKMEIRHDVNAHAIARICVIAREEDQQEILSRDWTDTEITVLKRGEESLPLFSGRVEKLVCDKEGRLLTVLICGIGETAKLDREKKKQSFQKAEMTYGQVVQKITQNYQGSTVIWNIGDDKNIDMPLVQYEETDWEFLIRICSHFHEVIVPDLRTGRMVLHFGMCIGREQNGDVAEILGNGFDNSYYHNGCYESNMPRTQALYMKVKTKENWQIGDFWLYEGRKYQVYSRRILFENGELFFVYQLGMRGMFYAKKIQIKPWLVQGWKGLSERRKEKMSIYN